MPRRRPDDPKNVVPVRIEAVHRQLDCILAASRGQNAEAGATGALMFTGLFFVQILEGPAAAVEAAFDRICCDLRHSDIKVLEGGLRS